jgi:hypothetical protein
MRRSIARNSYVLGRRRGRRRRILSQKLNAIAFSYIFRQNEDANLQQSSHQSIKKRKFRSVIRYHFSHVEKTAKKKVNYDKSGTNSYLVGGGVPAMQQHSWRESVVCGVSSTFRSSPADQLLRTHGAFDFHAFPFNKDGLSYPGHE